MRHDIADADPAGPSDKLAAMLVARPQGALALLGMLCLLSLFGLRGLELDNRLEVWFPDDSVALRDYRAYKSSFGEDLSLYVIYRGEDLFSAESLALIRDLSDSFGALPYVETVASITSVQLRRALAIGQVPVDLLAGDLIPRDAARRYLTTDPVYRDNLISQDGMATGIEVALRPLAFAERPAVVAAVNEILAEPPYTGLDLHVIGGLPILTEMDRLSQDEARTFTAFALLAIYVLLAVSLRSLVVAAVPLLVAGVATLYALALFAVFGHSLNMVTSILPLVILVLAVADSVHLLKRFVNSRMTGGDAAGALRAAIVTAIGPCFFTTITTAVALLSFTLSESPPLRAFGGFAALGVLLAFAVAFLLIPALLLSLPSGIRQGFRSGDRTTALFTETARRLVETRARSVIVVSGIVVVASLVFASRLEFQTDQINYLRQDNPVRVANARMQAWFDGVYPLDLVLRTEEEGRFFEVAELRRVDELAKAFLTDPVVQTVITPGSYLASYGRGLFSSPDRIGAADGWPTGPDPGPVDGFFEALSKQGRHVISKDGTMAKLSIRATWLDNRETLTLIERLSNLLRDRVGDAGIDWYFSGFSVMYVELNDQVIQSQIRSLAVSAVAIFAMLWLFTRSIRLAVLGMIPNLLPVVTTLGLMGLAGVKLDVATILIASISLGVAVDDTIHLLSAYQKAPPEMRPRERIAAVFEGIGSPIVLTTILLIAGFAMLLGSSFLPLVYFGLFLCLNIAFALAYDLLLLPVLLLRFSERPSRASFGRRGLRK